MNAMIGRMSGRRMARGFTLIELLVTLAVIAIMFSIGVPMYGSFTRGSAITSHTSELIAAINYTRSEAVARRQSVQLVATGGDWVNGWQVNTVVAPVTLLQVVDLARNQAEVVVTEASNTTQLTFDGQGRADSALSYTICPIGGGAVGRTVTVSLLGRVTVRQLNCP